MIEELTREKEKLTKSRDELLEEQQLFVGKLVQMGLMDKMTKAEINKLTTDRAAAEDMIKMFQHEVGMWNSEL